VSVLVDTNVFCELARPAPSPGVQSWAEGFESFAISVITIDEVSFGLTFKPNARIQRWFESFVETYCRILEITAPIARHAGILRGQLARRGRPRTQADMLIAATATQHGLTLATRNRKDFEGCGIAVINPFS
jgi:predicted nucleic acid-binding protein